ncbi:unnamed protein product, partial [Amoebophrya sp. A120]
ANNKTRSGDDDGVDVPSRRSSSPIAMGRESTTCCESDSGMEKVASWEVRDVDFASQGSATRARAASREDAKNAEDRLLPRNRSSARETVSSYGGNLKNGPPPFSQRSSRRNSVASVTPIEGRDDDVNSERSETSIFIPHHDGSSGAGFGSGFYGSMMQDQIMQTQGKAAVTEAENAEQEEMAQNNDHDAQKRVSCTASWGFWTWAAVVLATLSIVGALAVGIFYLVKHFQGSGGSEQKMQLLQIAPEFSFKDLLLAISASAAVNNGGALQQQAAADVDPAAPDQPEAGVQSVHFLAPNRSVQGKQTAMMHREATEMSTAFQHLAQHPHEHYPEHCKVGNNDRLTPNQKLLWMRLVNMPIGPLDRLGAEGRESVIRVADARKTSLKELKQRLEAGLRQHVKNLKTFLNLFVDAAEQQPGDLENYVDAVLERAKIPVSEVGEKACIAEHFLRMLQLISEKFEREQQGSTPQGNVDPDGPNGETRTATVPLLALSLCDESEQLERLCEDDNVK